MVTGRKSGLPAGDRVGIMLNHISPSLAARLAGRELRRPAARTSQRSHQHPVAGPGPAAPAASGLPMETPPPGNIGPASAAGNSAPAHPVQPCVIAERPRQFRPEDQAGCPSPTPQPRRLRRTADGRDRPLPPAPATPGRVTVYVRTSAPAAGRTARPVRLIVAACLPFRVQGNRQAKQGHHDAHHSVHGQKRAIAESAVEETLKRPIQPADQPHRHQQRGRGKSDDNQSGQQSEATTSPPPDNGLIIQQFGPDRPGDRRRRQAFSLGRVLDDSRGMSRRSGRDLSAQACWWLTMRSRWRTPIAEERDARLSVPQGEHPGAAQVASGQPDPGHRRDRSALRLEGGDEGLDILRQARGLSPAPEVILITAFDARSTPAGRQHGRGVRLHITKPVDLGELRGGPAGRRADPAHPPGQPAPRATRRGIPDSTASSANRRR